MSLVLEKYVALAPTADFVSDEVVLAMAWKKAQAYVRRHNWYADTLELDCAAIDLGEKLKTWASELRTRKFLPAPARVVPAPKNSRWIFGVGLPGGWGPLHSSVTKKAPQKPNRLDLRPLAHLGIREQTAATAVMLCLADCVESAQGDPATDPTDALRKGVYSYGNRLHCQWTEDGGTASFSWGSVDSYSRYFQDYQQFVKRPKAIAESLDHSSSDKNRIVFIVKLDLSGFYDGIDVPLLIEMLREEYRRFRRLGKTTLDDDDDFWKVAKQALNFEWSSADVTLATLMKGDALPTGLPQGLMPSGFFANAYLLKFDRAIGAACHSLEEVPFGDGTATLHDYCRYVDDLRLVVSVERSTSEQIDSESITEWVQQRLDESIGIADSEQKGRLTLNNAKTDIELVSRVAGATGVGLRMKQLQQQLSGPFDLSSLEQLETGLHGLLSLAESSMATAFGENMGGVSRLASIARTPLEVRDDTLTRFAAYRLCKTLRQRRLLLDLTEHNEGRTAGDVLLQDYELTARRLIGAWTENPALVQVLRYAFDLFPSPDLLEDVLSALAQKLLDADRYPDQAAVAWYVIAELLRAGATETGRRSQGDVGFSAGELSAYRELLAVYSTNLLHCGEVPWFVQQQAALLLSSVNSPIGQLDDSRELSRYRMLQAYLNGQVLCGDDGQSDAITTAIVGYQVTQDVQHFIRWLEKFSLHAGIAATRNAFSLVYNGCPDLFYRITGDQKGKSLSRKASLPIELAMHAKAIQNDGQSSLPPNEWLPLANAIAHPDHVFQQENALLKLALAMACLPEERWTKGDIQSQFDLAVRCSDWDAINDPRTDNIDVKPLRRSEVRVEVPDAPAWCRPELKWLYVFGKVLRAAALGNNDFTASVQLGGAEVGWYKGLTTTTGKRRLGMLHSSQALGGTSSAITPWFSSLLGEMLRWPGTASDSPSHQAQSIEDLTRLIKERMQLQSAIYGQSSASPVYRYPVPWNLRKERLLRVAVVQGLLPQSGDFKSAGLAGMDAAPYRERHRNHTAALLRLAAKKISAHSGAHGRKSKSEVDLVVLPEFSIHINDQDLLRAFSDETGAMLHYGLLGASDPKSGSPTNVARWLIPVRTNLKRSWIEVDQGKLHLTNEELHLGITKWCPYRVVVELSFPKEPGYRMASAICYDATDLALAADLKNETHMFLVPAMNKDVKTFDSMVAALRYHMYQHIVISNAGEFGGSTVQAPYGDEYRRIISHSHGANQISVSVFDVPLDDFGPQLLAAGSGIGKTPPAALQRRK